MESKANELPSGADIEAPNVVTTQGAERDALDPKDISTAMIMCSYDSNVDDNNAPRVEPPHDYATRSGKASRFRRMDSVRSVQSRMSVDSLGNSMDEATAMVRALARDLFRAWDISRTNAITLQDIIDGGIDEEFASAILRCADVSGDGSISIEDLRSFLMHLKLGSLEEKVLLMIRFLDSNGDGKISYDEMEQYLRAAPVELAKKLGLDTLREGSAKSGNDYFSLEQLMGVFLNHDRGEEAIAVFCHHILVTLESRPRINTRRQSRARSLYNIMSLRSDEDETNNSQALTKNVFHILYVAVRSIPKQQMFVAALVLLQIALWIYYFMYHYQRAFPIPYCIAKGFGLNLRVLSIFLFASMARTTMGLVFNFPPLKWLVPMGFNIQVHSFCGFCTVIHAFGHMFGHITFHEIYVKGGFSHSFVQNSLLRGASWDNHGRGDAITGYILMLTLLAMAISALFRSKSSFTYERFSLIHFLYNIWLLFLFLHVPHLWVYFFITAVVFYCERIFDRVQQTHTETLRTSRPCSNGVTFLSVPRHGDPTYPGSYYRIKVPDIAPLEWHPFSLAGSAASHHLTFFCDSVGDWTSELYKIVSDPELRAKTTVLVQGPFYAPAHTAAVLNPTKRTLLVASGIGITPFFSVMATKVSDEQSYETDEDVYSSLFDEDLVDPRQHSSPHSNARKVASSMLKAVGLSRRFSTRDEDFRSVSMDFNEAERCAEEMREVQMLRVVWTIRDPKALMFYLDYVYELVKHQNNLKQPMVQVDVYLTGLGKGTDLKFMLQRTFFLLSIAKRTSTYMKIFFGRPDMESIIQEIRPHNVYYCGGKFLKDSLAEICIKREIPFHPEDFDSGASIARDAIAKVKTTLRPRRGSTAARPPGAADAKPNK